MPSSGKLVKVQGIGVFKKIYIKSGSSKKSDLYDSFYERYCFSNDLFIQHDSSVKSDNKRLFATLARAAMTVFKTSADDFTD